MTAIIDAATARFELYQATRKELASTRAKLAERKLVEKAKGIVMEQRKLSEDQAYNTLRKMAMDQNLALAEVARRVIAVAQLLA
jgi:response regulator NasT